MIELTDEQIQKGRDYYVSGFHADIQGQPYKKLDPDTAINNGFIEAFNAIFGSLSLKQIKQLEESRKIKQVLWIRFEENDCLQAEWVNEGEEMESPWHCVPTKTKEVYEDEE